MSESKKGMIKQSGLPKGSKITVYDKEGNVVDVLEVKN